MGAPSELCECETPGTSTAPYLTQCQSLGVHYQPSRRAFQTLEPAAVQAHGPNCCCVLDLDMLCSMGLTSARPAGLPLVNSNVGL